MKNIALAILSVGLCFYSLFRLKVTGEADIVAGIISFIAAIAVFIV